jgi:hypothetical protein
MYEAAIVVWAARVGDELVSMSTEAKVDSFIAHMDAVSKEKEFTRFWWHNFMSTYGLLYMILREAIHRADALDIEVVVRKAVPLFAFTYKFKYAQLHLYNLTNMLIRPYCVQALARFNRIVNLTGKRNQNAVNDKLIEDLQGGNGGVKSMLKPGSSDKRYKIISLVVLQLKAAVTQYHEEVDQQRAKAKIPKMVQDKESLKDHFVAMGMFGMDGQPLPLTNLFSNRLSTQNKVHEWYMNI